MSEKCSTMKRGSVCGVGIYEAGKYTATDISGPTRLYDIWSKMLQRCYSAKVQKRSPSYIGCSVDTRFHHFQDFCEWAVVQKGFSEGYHLDKDILVRGNRVYGPDTCAFVPPIINNLTLHCQKKRGLFPIGVCYHKTNKTFTAKLSVGWVKIAKGGFKQPEHAFYYYKQEKERVIKELAVEYQEGIDSRVYNRLMVWEIHVDD